MPVQVALWGWQEGGECGVDALVRDIRERWVMRRALESLHRTHEALLASAGEGIIGLDPQGRTTFVNPAAENLLGWKAAELMGLPFQTLAASDTGSRASPPPGECPVLDSLSSGELVRAETCFLRKDGSLFPVTLCSIPLFSESELEGAVLLFQDITSRRRAEDALRASEVRFRKLFLNAPIGMMRVSLEGEVQNANLALARALGYDSPDHLLDKHFSEDLQGGWGSIRRLWEDEGSRDRLEPAEVSLRGVDGNPVFLRIGGVLSRGPEGEPEAVEMILEDLSERKALEDQLRQSQKMEALGQLTAGIAHDFNNELSVIRMSADLLADSVREALPEVFEEVEGILDATHRASEITRDLLGFSRQAELSLLDMDVSWLMDKFSRILRVAMPERIQVNMDAGPPVGSIRADPVAVEQILLNLVTNARDAMPGNGTLTLGVERVDVEPGGRYWEPGVEPGPYIRIFVTDTGEGMAESTLARAFEPFFSTKAPGEGTGLGLAMVYGLMKQHAGLVNIQSEPEGGTTVNLLFPRSAEGIQPMALPEEDPDATGGRRVILVVEDEPAVRTLAQRMLERSGFQVLTAADGVEALEVLEAEEEKVHLILTDLEMPRMGGMEFFKRLREAGRGTPVILASGYQSVSGLQEISGEWKEDLVHLQKPWTRSDFLEAVRAALARTIPTG